jgi:thiamine pyrophosphokinase
MFNENNCIILAAGDFPTAPEPLAALKAADYICCCDSAAKSLLAWGREPDAIVGDGDSIDDEIREKYSDRWHQVAEQEDNDLTKATRFCMAQGFTHITYLGATGKREDHTIGNISLLMEYMRMGAEVRSYTDYGIFIPCKDTCTFGCREGQQVSIFNFTAKGLKSKGLAYPIYDFTTWWQGTLNKCVDTSFTIEAEGEYLVFLNY